MFDPNQVARLLCAAIDRLNLRPSLAQGKDTVQSQLESTLEQFRRKAVN